MRQIGTIATQADALKFANYLTTLGIAARVDDSPTGFTVWAIEENEVERAKQTLAEFQANPVDPRYAAAQGEAEAIRRRQATEQRSAQKRVVDMRQRWDGPIWRLIPLTLTLIAAATAVTFASDYGHAAWSDRWFYLSASGMKLSELREGQLWRLWTPGLMHADFIHLAFNMYWLYTLGAAIEIRKGAKTLAIVALVGQLAASLGQIYLGQPNYLGFSGANYALFGYVWMKSRYEPSAGLYLDSTTVLLMIGWALYCLTNENVANGGHFGGLAAGIALGFPIRRLLR